MNNLIKIIIYSLIGLIVISFSIYLISQFRKEKVSQSNDTEEKSSLLLGISGYIPTNHPNTSLFDTAMYWNELPNRAQIYGVHVDWRDINTMNRLVKNSKLPVSLVVGYQTPDDWDDNDEVLSNLRNVLQKNKNIKYLALGNEVNLIKNEYPKEFNEFIKGFNEITQMLKKEYPELGIQLVFQYDALRGKSLLSGKKYSNDLKLIKQFENSVDSFAFTVYPFLEYKKVNDIPDEYLSEISKFTSKPISIVETSWPTQNLAKSSYQFNEQEQLRYFEYLKGKSSTIESIKFINAVFLNDIADWKNDKTIDYSLFNSLGIRYNDGTEKVSYKFWNDWVKENK